MDTGNLRDELAFFGGGRDIEKAIRLLIDVGWDGPLPLLRQLDATEQDPDWHPEGNVLTHSLMAADAAAAAADRDHLDPAERELVVFAALLHDAGKPTTTVRTAGGRVTSHGHDAQGAAVARRFMLDIGSPQALADKIAVLTREHMAHATLGDDPTPAALRRLVRRLGDGQVTIDEWARVVDADRAGRGPGSKPPRGSLWARRARHLAPLRTPLLRGEDLMELGWEPGPEFGAVIQASLEAQDDGAFVDHDGAVRWLRASQFTAP